MSDASGRPVGSVARALALLDALAEGPAGVNALARRIGVNPSSASRLLATLERGGLVEREPGGPYRLGLHLVALADRVLARLDVRDLARPQLRALVEQTGETATLSVPGGDEAVTVDFVAGESSVVSMARLGRPSIGHATAVGQGAARVRRRRCPACWTPTPSARSPIRSARRRAGAPCASRAGPRPRASASPTSTRSPRRSSGRGGELVAILGLQGPAARFTAAAPRRGAPAPARGGRRGLARARRRLSDDSADRGRSERHEQGHLPDLGLARRLRRRAEPEPRRPARRGRRAPARVGVRDRRAGARSTAASGGERNADSEVIAEVSQDIGAYVMGRKMFGGGDGPWDESWQRLVGRGPALPRAGLRPHAPPARAAGDAGRHDVHFVTDGIESALEQARAAAGDKDVTIAGGAQAVQQYLAAGLLDELHLHIVPVVLGGGRAAARGRRRPAARAGRGRRRRRRSRTSSTGSSAERRLRRLEPAGFWRHFEALIAIPRATYEEDAAVAHVVALGRRARLRDAPRRRGQPRRRRPGDARPRARADRDPAGPPRHRLRARSRTARTTRARAASTSSATATGCAPTARRSAPTTASRSRRCSRWPRAARRTARSSC